MTFHGRSKIIVAEGNARDKEKSSLQFIVLTFKSLLTSTHESFLCIENYPMLIIFITKMKINTLSDFIVNNHSQRDKCAIL
jgi:hypothetical protein